ncbi:hypothetical protein ABZ949_02320 [Micromonospora tulbaghiae]|uniref:hypothetical protein n=1 Tax=Micromonospora tulbaghiae TaxID=479978 RepID=UPI0033C06E5E
MRPNHEYRALTVINVAGVRAYNPGDDVPASAVDNLGLVVGEHVRPANADVIPHPGGNAKVADLRKFALGQGVDPEVVEEMTRAQILDRFPPAEAAEPAAPPPSVNVDAPAESLPDVVAGQAAEQTASPEHPGPNATKPQLVDYAAALGMERGEAEKLTAKQLAAQLPE